MDIDSIKQSIKTFVLQEFLPGEDAAELTDDIEMFTQGILDSLASLKLVSFLEEEFGITIEPHEVDAEFLDTLSLIAELVVSKQT